MKVKIELALADWRESATNESVYFTEVGLDLTMFDLHAGTIFDGEIELDECGVAILERALKDGFHPVFDLITAEVPEEE